MINGQATFCTNCGVRVVGSDDGVSLRAAAPGRIFLFVVGILYVVFSGFGILGAINGFALSEFWDDTFVMGTMSWGVYYFIVLVIAGYELFMGIMGILNRNKSQNAGILMAFAIVAIFVTVIWGVISTNAVGGIFAGTELEFLFNGFGVLAFMAIIIGLVLPVLYLIGAYLNAKAYKRLS